MTKINSSFKRDKAELNQSLEIYGFSKTFRYEKNHTANKLPYYVFGCEIFKKNLADNKKAIFFKPKYPETKIT